MNKLNSIYRLLRLHRPIPILLLLWPTYWALILANKGLPSWHLFFVFTLGVILMRSAGCVFNDIADRKLDGQVARTKTRPLANNELSVKTAIFIAFSLCCIAFLLVLTLNRLTIALSFVALCLAVIYPFMKRITYLPQLVLGAAFNFGIIMAFSASINALPVIAWITYAAALIWTFAYDSWYAMEDQEDDSKIGIKSSALLFGEHAPLWIAALQCLFVILMLVIGRLCHFHRTYDEILSLSIAFIIYQQILGNKKAYITAFNNNHWIGLIITAAILIQYPL